MTKAEEIRQLERQLADCGDTTTAQLHQKIDTINNLAWALSDTDVERALSLSETAYTLAITPRQTDSRPYQLGMAYSLRTQGYLNQRSGDYPLGLQQLFQAQQIFEAEQHPAGLPDVLDGITGIYYQTGNFPEAFEYGYNQLAAARHINDKKRMANAHNNLACLYFDTGDFDRSFEILQRNLEIAAETGYTRIESLSHMNLAEAHTLAGNFQKALDYALIGLKINRQAKFELFEVYSLNTIGEIYIKLGDMVSAGVHLEQALARARKMQSKVVEALVLLNLGRVALQRGAFEQAVAFAHETLAVARDINARSELYKAHLLLSEIFEQKGDFVRALEHHKQYQASKEVLLGEKSDQRLKVLQVALDTQAARAEAKLLQQQTVELQWEVNERARAETQVQRQRDYARVLSACSQTLLQPSGSEADNRRLLAEALRHLIKPTQASKVFLYENFNDPDLGFCSRFVLDVCTDGVPSASEDPKSVVIPWSIVPPENRRRLAAGRSIGGPVNTLFADTPAFRDYLLNEVRVLSIQFLPIHFADTWWGYVGFDDRVYERNWQEEEILLLSTTAEMLSSTLQRWQAEGQLRRTNELLEQQVKIRTADLSDTVQLLEQEVKERERVETELQQVLVSLERRVAARTEELSAFFDLTVLAGRATNLAEVFELATPRILEASHSQAICLHLFDDDRTGLYLAAHHSLPTDARPALDSVSLSPGLRLWLLQPSDPLVTSNLSAFKILPPTFRLPNCEIYLGMQIRTGNRIEGLISCYRFSGNGFGLDVISLVAALAQQMGMVLETYRLRQAAGEIAVLEERQRLARDLHDSVNQSLYSLSLFSRAATEAAADGDTARLNLSLSRLGENTLRALREMRLLLYQLRPADLEQQGLKQALETRVSAVEHRVGLQVELAIDDFPQMSPACEIQLYHIVIEAMNNVVKHAAATRLTLELIRVDKRARLRIVDDGQGFQSDNSTGGLGLKHIKERVAQLNGQFTISSESGKGTRLEAVFPLQFEEG
jgi:signal transduction histidine kinase